MQPCRSVFVLSNPANWVWVLLLKILHDRADVGVVGTVTDGAAALECLASLSGVPDLLLVSAEVPGISDLAAFHQALAERSSPDRIILCSPWYRSDIDHLRRRLGIRSYLCWNTVASTARVDPTNCLVHMLDVVLDGFALQTPDVPLQDPSANQEDLLASSSHPALGDLDAQVLTWLSNGRTQKEIALELGGDTKRRIRHVERVVERLRKRFGVTTTAELLTSAAAAGVVMPDRAAPKVPPLR